jgi:hypothetical protein
VYATNAMTTTGWSQHKPVSAFRNEASVELEEWASAFPRVVFSALQGGKPFTNLLAQAKKEGLQTIMEERPVTANGRNAKQVRIFMTRKAAEVPKKGALEYELIVDDEFKLPVTIKAYVKPPNQPESRIMWTIKWGKPAPGEKIQDTNFKVEKPTAPEPRRGQSV